MLSKPPLYINNNIIYYSEQMTESENENDHFDLDHFDHMFVLPWKKLNGLYLNPVIG